MGNTGGIIHTESYMEKYTGLEIAIIGMSGIFPGANDIASFWENLKNGVESISFFTDEELLESGENPTLLQDPNYVKSSAIVNGKEYFDAEFFNYLPDEARLMDPQMRVFHECVWAALEDAGYGQRDSQNKVGLFAGSNGSTNWEVYSHLVNKEGLIDDFSASHLSSSRFIASKTSYALNLRGPAVYVDTACSTSLVAVHHACKSLLLGECDLAVAGGITIRNKSKKGYLYTEGLAGSKDGHCRTFDAKSSGTVGGEGGGAIVLKLCKHAMRDGDNIWAIIRGSGINNDGSNKVAYTAPSIDGQMEAIMMAQKWAKVPPESITLIEAHGTGTVLGDPIEMEALNRVFGKSREKYCAIGSVKTNIGHLDAAAGMAGIIKTVLSLKYGQIPPSLHFESPNPKINFTDTPFYVNTELKKWENEKFPLRAGVSSFGIGGTNAHLILEEAPVANSSSESRAHQLMLISAKTEKALERNINKLIQYLEKEETPKLADVAYTLNTGREHFPCRQTIVFKEKKEAIDQLETLKSKKAKSVKLNRKPLVFMFAGLGSQYTNMCADLYQQEPAFKKRLDECFDIFSSITQVDLKAIVFTEGEDSPPSGKLDQIKYAHPAIFSMEYALAQLLMDWGIKPDYLIGHSIGEYAAACLSGVFSLEDAMGIVIKRSQLIQEADKGKMLGISISEVELEPFINQSQKLSVAAINSSELCVVSGESQEIEDFQKFIQEKGYVSQQIRSSHASHSHMMDEILGDFEQEVRKVSIHPPRIPFISNLTGKEASHEEISNPQYWVNHLRKTVRFSDGISTLLKNEHTLFIEIGPGIVLGTFVRANNEIDKTHKVINTVRHENKEENDVKYLLSSVGKLWQNGIGLNWEQFYVDEKRARVSLPTYSFEKRAYPVLVDSFRMISRLISEDSWEKQKEIEKWYYLPSWKLAPLLSKSGKKEGSTLIFSDPYGVSDSLADRLLKEGEHLVRVGIGPHFLKESESSYQLNPGKEEDFVSLFQDLSAAGIQPDRIIHAWAITQGEGNSAENGALISKMDRFYYSLVYAIKAAQEHGGILGKQIQVLSSGLHGIIAKEESDPYKGIVLGLLKVIPQEYPSVISKHIDIATSEIGSDKLKDLLYEEIADGQSGKMVAISHGQRWEQIYERTPIQETQDIIPIKESGVYLLTGGLGELGYTLSMSLVSDYRAKVILLGRSKLGPRSAWGELLADEAVSEKKKDRIRKLMKLEEMGGEVSYVAGNIANREDISKAIGIAEEKYGGIHGVIHAAGVVDGRSINALTKLEKEDYALQFEPKIQGLAALREALKGKELDFCLLTSSMSPIIGGLGFTAYASANSFMDCYIQSHKAEGELQNWISVNVDGVNFLGNAKDLIEPHELFEAIRRALLYKNQPQVVVSAVDLSKRLEKWVQMAHVAEGEPEIEAKQEEIEDLRVLRPDLSSTEASLLQLWQNFFGKAELEIDDNFFEVGGDSLKALTMIGRIFKTFGVEVDIKTFFNNSTIRLISKFIDSEETKNEITSSYLSVPISELKEVYALSSAQKRLYFLYEFDKSSLAYNLPSIIILEGNLDQSKLNDAFRKLIAQQDSLRTSFEVLDNEVIQRINENVPFEIESYTSSEEEANQLIEQFIRPFHLHQAPLFRAGTIKLAENRHMLIVDMHHIISDGISEGLLRKGFMAFYNDQVLENAQLQYKDYAEWQQNVNQQKSTFAQKEFWLNEFSEPVSPLQLPTDFPRPSLMSFKGNSVRVKLGAEETLGLKEVAMQEGATLFMVILSAFNILLSKLSNQEDVVVGTPVANRQHTDFEKIIGMFVNTLAIRNSAKGKLSLKEFIAEVKAKTIACFANQAYQYEDLIDDLKLERDTSRNALFDCMLVFHNTGATDLVMSDLRVLPYNYKKKVSKFDLTLEVAEVGEHLYLMFEYATSLFKEETIHRFIGYFQQIVATILSDVETPLSAIDILPAVEKRTLLHAFNETKVPFSPEQQFPELFISKVSKYADRSALVYKDQRVSYQELHEQASHLARVLRDQGIGLNSRVVVLMPRGIETITSLLAIFYVGGVYVPIDHQYPTQRKLEIIRDCDASMILMSRASQEEVLETIELSENKIAGLVVDDLPRGLNDAEALSLEPIEPSTLAYILYTSGSTGKPKGAMIHHAGMLNHLYAKIEDLGISESDVIAQTASVSFDISIWQMLVGLLCGAEVVILEKERVLLPEDFAQAISESGITLAESVPSMLTNFLSGLSHEDDLKLKSLRWIIATGESLNVNLAEKWVGRFPQIQMMNAYGPTEASDDVTHHVVDLEKDGQAIPIGNPIRNTRIYIVDKELNLCPQGVRGEICVSGIGVGLGYWGLESKSREVFIPNPFKDEYEGTQDEILYRTGDLGYFRPDGSVVCLGRIDSQVKVLGNRVELGEIEQRLGSHPQIEEVVVEAKKRSGVYSYLVAYYVSGAPISVKDLRSYLLDQLPDYMIPHYYERIEEMPLTPNGKLDRKALPDPKMTTEEDYVPPSNEIEKKLIDIWAEVLELPNNAINKHKNFFEMGGNSIDLLKVNKKISEAFTLNISIANMFMLPTISDLAYFITQDDQKMDELEKQLDEREEILSLIDKD